MLCMWVQCASRYQVVLVGSFSLHSCTLPIHYLSLIKDIPWITESICNQKWRNLKQQWKKYIDNQGFDTPRPSDMTRVLWLDLWNRRQQPHNSSTVHDGDCDHCRYDHYSISRPFLALRTQVIVLVTHMLCMWVECASLYQVVLVGSFSLHSCALLLDKIHYLSLSPAKVKTCLSWEDCCSKYDSKATVIRTLFLLTFVSQMSSACMCVCVCTMLCKQVEWRNCIPALSLHHTQTNHTQLR